MPSSQQIDDLFVPRRTLFAVEVIDGVTGLPVYKDIEVQPLDANNRPINSSPTLNVSRRFVWLEPHNQWPAFVRVTSKRPIYLSGQVATTPPTDGAPATRLIPVVLLPTPAYPFDEGVVGVRGRLTAPPSGTRTEPVPVAGAVVTLLLGDIAKATATATTDVRGEFAAVVRPSPELARDAKLGRVLVTLGVSRTDVSGDPWVVPSDKWGVPGNTPGSFKTITDIPLGRLFGSDVDLSWPAN